MEKNRKAKKTFRSFAEWEEYNFPKKTEKEKLEKLMEDSNSYGTYLANNIVDRIIKATN